MDPVSKIDRISSRLMERMADGSTPISTKRSATPPEVGFELAWGRRWKTLIAWKWEVLTDMNKKVLTDWVVTRHTLDRRLPTFNRNALVVGMV